MVRIDSLINISSFFIVKQAHYDALLESMNLTITNDSNYFMGLLLANIFAYLVIIVFLFALFYVLRRIRRMIRRALT